MFDFKAIRKAAGLSQVRLAHRARVSRFRLSLAESGELELRADELAAIREVLAPEVERAARVVAGFSGAQQHLADVAV